MLKSPLGRFRIIGYLEGVSFLVLLGIGMPLKYKAGMPEAVLITGWIHGLLFILYVIAAVQASTAHRWSRRRLVGALLAGVLPFGPFVFDWWLRRADRLDAPERPEKPVGQ